MRREPGSRRHWRIGLAALAFCAIAPIAALAEPYRLNPQDRVLIRVLTLAFSQTGQVNLDNLSGEYTITPEGQLLLPLAGPLDAKALSLAELAEAASGLLRQAAGMADPLHVSVELVSSAPVYVMGAVQNRGAVEFRPGLTARQALALAGDIARLPASDDMMRALSLSGDILIAQDRLRRLRHEETLIRQELSVQPGDDPVVQQTDRPAPSAGKPADVQARILAADRASRRSQMESLGSLQDLLVSKIDRLRQQMVLRDEQIAAVRRDLESVQSLKERGLALTARVTALSTSLSDLEAKRLELETTLLLTEQELNQAERDEGMIGFDAQTGMLRRLGELQNDIAAEEINLDNMRQMQLQMQFQIGANDAAAEAVPMQPAYTIIRVDDGKAVALRAGADTPLKPGDTVEVSLPDVSTIAAAP